MHSLPIFATSLTFPPANIVEIDDNEQDDAYNDDVSSSSSCTSEGMPNLIPAGDLVDDEQYDYDSDSENDWAEAYLESAGVQVFDEF